MSQVAIIHDPSSKHASAWVSWLQLSGFHVTTIYDENSFETSKLKDYDLVIPLITIRDYLNRDNARMQALTFFDSKKVKLLTPYNAISASSDKLLTAQTLLKYSLPHPSTYLAKDYFQGTKPFLPCIMKPRFGHSGQGIFLAQTVEELLNHQDGDYLVQQLIEDAVCIRVITSSTEILNAYEKVPPASELIANIDNGAIRKAVTLSDEMKHLATETVKAFGGGLMGVDLLNSPKGLFVLEANVPFGFDKNDNKLRDKLVTFIKKEAQ